MTLTPDDAPVALLSDEAERTLAESLRAAYAPEPLDDELNEALILAALDDPLAPPSAAELAESEALRRALEGEGEHPDAALARALRAAAAPGALRPEPGERLLAR
ncbi:MAG: hypothetical protein OZ921_17305, partial [Sorangiineae bacterium]|nr:hypothetical protein [Sorangiineae bacterium]